jgi:hypothetical protein
MEPPLRWLVEKRLPHRPKRRKSGLIVNVIAVQFSSFGSLFTTFSNYSSSQPERLPEEVAAGLVQTVSAAGFVYVPEEALETCGVPKFGSHLAKAAICRDDAKEDGMDTFWAIVTFAVVVAILAVVLWVFVLAPLIVPRRHVR